MSDTQANECLSFSDAFFLYLEQPGAPINVAAISAFEGIIPLDACTRFVESKLPLIPRFLKRVVIPPLSIGPPTLQFDPHFDIQNHIRAIKLKHGSDAQWKATVSEILSTHLDRRRPLWDMTLLHGLKGDRTGVIVRIHHCLVDGVAGVGLLNTLLDPSPVVPPLRRKKLSVPPPAPHDPGTGLLDTLINSCFSTGQAFLTAHSELLRLAQQFSIPDEKNETPADNIQAAVRPLSRIAPLGDLARLLSELAQPTEKLPYNILCRGPQTFEWTELPMAEIDAVRQACGATVNEVVLTVLCGALRRYAELHDLKVKGRKLRIVIPVNVRTQGQISSAGNQITFLPVDIPLNAREPRKLLALVQDRVKFSKTAHGAELIGMTAMLLAATPPPLQSLFGTILSQLPISVCNSICTNIPGPRTPLYLLGHKMVAAYPCVPIGGEMGMNCAVLSYNGTLFVGFTGDAQAIPDIASLSEFFPASFAELRNAIDVPAPKREAAKNHAASNQASKSEAPKSKRPRRKTRVPAGASLQVPQPAADGASGSSETAPGELLKEAASA